MRRAPGMDPDLEIGEALHERPARPCMVEVDVSQQQSTRLLCQPFEQRLDAALGPRVHDRTTEVPCPDHALTVALPDVDELGMRRHRAKANGGTAIKLLS